MYGGSGPGDRDGGAGGGHSSGGWGGGGSSSRSSSNGTGAGPGGDGSGNGYGGGNDKGSDRSGSSDNGGSKSGGGNESRSGSDRSGSADRSGDHHDRSSGFASSMSVATKAKAQPAPAAKELAEGGSVDVVGLAEKALNDYDNQRLTDRVESSLLAAETLETLEATRPQSEKVDVAAVAQRGLDKHYVSQLSDRTDSAIGNYEREETAKLDKLFVDFLGKSIVESDLAATGLLSEEELNEAAQVTDEARELYESARDNSPLNSAGVVTDLSFFEEAGKPFVERLMPSLAATAAMNKIMGDIASPVINALPDYVEIPVRALIGTLSSRVAWPFAKKPQDALQREFGIEPTDPADSWYQTDDLAPGTASAIASYVTAKSIEGFIGPTQAATWAGYSKVLLGSTAVSSAVFVAADATAKAIVSIPGVREAIEGWKASVVDSIAGFGADLYQDGPMAVVDRIQDLVEPTYDAAGVNSDSSSLVGTTTGEALDRMEARAAYDEQYTMDLGVLGRMPSVDAPTFEAFYAEEWGRPTLAEVEQDLLEMSAGLSSRAPEVLSELEGVGLQNPEIEDGLSLPVADEVVFSSVADTLPEIAPEEEGFVVGSTATARSSVLDRLREMVTESQTSSSEQETAPEQSVQLAVDQDGRFTFERVQDDNHSSSGDHDGSTSLPWIPCPNAEGDLVGALLCHHARSQSASEEKVAASDLHCADAYDATACDAGLWQQEPEAMLVA